MDSQEKSARGWLPFTVEEIEEAVANGEDLNALNGTGASAIFNSCKSNNLDGVKALIEHGADVNIESGKVFLFLKPVHLAASQGSVPLLDCLVEAGADINSNSLGRTPLSMACSAEKMDVVDRLLSLGVDLETKDSKEQTPLMTAAQKKNVNVVDRLLAAGADSNASTSSGTSAIMFAARSGSVDILDRLVAFGANYLHTDNKGTNLLMAASEQENVAIIERILSLGIDINAQDHSGKTALFYASRKRLLETVLALLRKGADRNIVDEHGVKAAQISRDPDVTEILNCDDLSLYSEL